MIPIDEFCALVDIVTKRHGKDVMVAACDSDGHMHLTKKATELISGTITDRHLGYIDIRTGSLVWDDVQ